MSIVTTCVGVGGGAGVDVAGGAGTGCAGEGCAGTGVVGAAQAKVKPQISIAMSSKNSFVIVSSP
jgi:hypothetical protein